MVARKKLREDLNEEFDSKQEANIARIFRLLDIKYERKHKRKIEFVEIARDHDFRRTQSGNLIQWMEPDFYLPDTDTFIEAKTGGVDLNDRMRISAALLKGENVRLEVIGSRVYKILEKAFKDKIGSKWET